MTHSWALLSTANEQTTKSTGYASLLGLRGSGLPLGGCCWRGWRRRSLRIWQFSGRWRCVVIGKLWRRQRRGWHREGRLLADVVGGRNGILTTPQHQLNRLSRPTLG